MTLPTGITVAVTDHAAERFRQRVGSRRGAMDVKPEIAARVASAWAAGRISETPPPGAGDNATGSVYVRCLTDRQVVYVGRVDRRAGEVLVITLWEDERLFRPRVPKRYTDALKDSEERRLEPWEQGPGRTP